LNEGAGIRKGPVEKESLDSKSIRFNPIGVIHLDLPQERYR